MALNVKHLNSDASFLLTFEPIIPESLGDSVIARPYTVLLDPWITGPSTVFHSKISTSTHKHPACISSLSELPVPDLVIISQHKTDHCNEATLRQLAPDGAKTQILAEPASARVIKSWKYFDQEKIRTIEPWKDPRLTGKESVIRVPVPPLWPGGQAGEVTVAFVPQKRDLAGLHAAIGITYRPPSTRNTIKFKLPTPPTTPESQAQTFVNAETKTPLASPERDDFLLPPTPPISPHSLRSVRSTSTLVSSPTRPYRSSPLRPLTSARNEDQNLPMSETQFSRPLSVIFSPHGIHYEHLEPYATSHLVSEAALPLTALLHCMDSISNPWWLGGNICSGFPTGLEIATKLGARIYVSAHDGEKDVKGLATGLLKTRRWDTDMSGTFPLSGRERQMGGSVGSSSKGQETKTMRMGSGEEVIVTGSGVLWRSGRNSPPASLTSPTEGLTEHALSKKGSAKFEKAKGRRDWNASTQPPITAPKKKVPKQLTLYKALSMRDLMRPTPKLAKEMWRESADSDSEPEINKPFVVTDLPHVESLKAARRLGIEDSLKPNAGEDRMVRFRLAT
ncbi:hypothetical protein F4780DRAFT_759061 [Xylariomycetidae sp. FL0641]|nr:hypothetical protein F4780DRAFT_759061 [Xylariomycetidae sp. FL0641]